MLPYLRQSDRARILTLSPPIDLAPSWFASRTAYTMSKYARPAIPDGANVSLEEIARRAGVGSATLHRHFPTRKNLLETRVLDKTRAPA